MPITPKEKKIIINKQINDILKDNFSGNVSTLSLQKVESLYNEGSISNKAYRFLKDVIKYQKQEDDEKIKVKYTYDLAEKPKIKMTYELLDILKDHFEDDVRNVKTSILKQLLKEK